jgi:hypothetical protein
MFLFLFLVRDNKEYMQVLRHIATTVDYVCCQSMRHGTSISNQYVRILFSMPCRLARRCGRSPYLLPHGPLGVQPQSRP